MNITKAKYAKNELSNKEDRIYATIDGEELVVPIDNQNRDYKAILEWIAKGNTVEEAD
tara:strand:- start:1045 stop:1218 length:174 start_codon:yes stop_codon:yes gene_type:complete